MKDNSTRAQNPVLKGFVVTAGIILLTTAIAKLWSACGDSKLLASADPIFGWEFRYVMLGAGGVELAVAMICLFSRRVELATWLIGWIATGFFAYRAGLWWIGWQRPCACLGNLTDA